MYSDRPNSFQRSLQTTKYERFVFTSNIRNVHYGHYCNLHPSTSSEDIIPLCLSDITFTINYLYVRLCRCVLCHGNNLVNFIGFSVCIENFKMLNSQSRRVRIIPVPKIKNNFLNPL